IYRDDYRSPLDQYLRLSGQAEEEGQRISTSMEASGRFHTNWLSMIYPRLLLARNLLREDGTIFISFDDSEAANLRKVCDEVFGEENFLGQVVWRTATDNNPTQIAVQHEYILCYARQKEVQGVWSRPSAKAALIVDKVNQLKKECDGDL